jgi:sec-independent protein translocase protein TatA
MPSLGPAEILVILVVALLVFGPNKMPEIAKQVGKGLREFRRVQQHLKSELRDVVSEFDQPTTTPVVDQQPVPMLPPRDDATALDTMGVDPTGAEAMGRELSAPSAVDAAPDSAVPTVTTNDVVMPAASLPPSTAQDPTPTAADSPHDTTPSTAAFPSPEPGAPGDPA